MIDMMDSAIPASDVAIAANASQGGHVRALWFD
jgi:hypothetical protein